METMYGIVESQSRDITDKHEYDDRVYPRV
jgi:hypothetical protein